MLWCVFLGSLVHGLTSQPLKCNTKTLLVLWFASHHLCFSFDFVSCISLFSLCRKRSRLWASATIQTLCLIIPPLWWRMNCGWWWSCSVVVSSVKWKKCSFWCVLSVISYLHIKFGLTFVVIYNLFLSQKCQALNFNVWIVLFDPHTVVGSVVYFAYLVK